jgi:sortase A
MWNVQTSENSEFKCASGVNLSPNGGRAVWIGIERLLLASGLMLLAIYGAARFDRMVRSRAALEKFATLGSAATSPSQGSAEDTDSSPEADSLQDLDSSQADFSLWSSPRVQTYKRAIVRQSNAPVAVLRIAKIRLEVPVFEGTDELALNRGAGRIRGTARPGESGNIGIAGHRDGFFRALKDVAVGDAIELKTPNGTDTYVIDQIQIVAPENVEVLRPRSEPSLTLITCYPFHFVGSAPQRYIVTASLLRETKNGSENLRDDPQFMQQWKRRNNEQAK